MKKIITLLILILLISLLFGFTTKDVDLKTSYEIEKQYVKAILNLELKQIDQEIIEIKHIDIRNNLASVKVITEDKTLIFNFKKENNTWKLLEIK